MARRSLISLRTRHPPRHLLWGSTGTKNPSYSDVLYVEPLIGPETVNTLPHATLAAFCDHGEAALTLEQGVDAQAQFHALGVAAIASTRKARARGEYPKAGHRGGARLARRECNASESQGQGGPFLAPLWMQAGGAEGGPAGRAKDAARHAPAAAQEAG
ncbi:MAG: transaldolase family protein [Gammaproteobacteria bacterium]